jgi:putative heme-binding domain-containing protein
MYRQTIEHPWSLPESLKKHLDLNAGNDRGRIYRIVPEGFKQPPKANLGQASIEELVNTLKNPNGWHRDTAARLLYEKQDKSAIPLLEKILSAKPASPDRLPALARLHALYALDGLGALKAEHVLAALNDPDEHLRRHAILLSEKFLQDPAARSKIAEKFDTLLADRSIEVRYQLTLTLSLLRDDQLPRRLAKILAAPDTDSWIKSAALNAIHDRALDLLRLLDPGGDLAPQLTQLIAARGIGDEIAALIELAIAQKTDAATMHLAAALATGLQKAGIPLEAEKGQPLIERATALAASASGNLQTRIDAVTVLGAVTWDPSADTLLPLLAPTQPREIQLVVLTALDHLDKGQLADEILSRWNTFTPTLRQPAAAMLIKRPARAVALLSAIQSRHFRPADLSPAQSAALRQNPDQAVKQLAGKLFTAPASNRQSVIQAFAPALDLKGNAIKGHEIYTARCATCHRMAGEGNALGPDLETVKNAGKEKLLTNILDPNKEVAPNYTAYVIETKEGDTQTGIIASESAAAVALKMAAGMELTLNRADIQSIKSTNQSMMPEGVEAGLKPQDLADLLEFVMQAKVESKP